MGVLPMSVIGTKKQQFRLGSEGGVSSIHFFSFGNVLTLQMPCTTMPTFCFQIVESLLKNVTQRLLDSSEEDITWYMKNVATENHAVCSLPNLLSFEQLSLIFYVVATCVKNV